LSKEATRKQHGRLMNPVVLEIDPHWYHKLSPRIQPSLIFDASKSPDTCSLQLVPSRAEKTRPNDSPQLYITVKIGI
jgi:hypothetical protein